MKEFVTVNGITLECIVKPKYDSIILTINGHSINELEEFFLNVTEFTTSLKYDDKDLCSINNIEDTETLDNDQNNDQNDDQDVILEKPHGIYKDLKLESITKNINDGSVDVTMHIKTDTEKRIEYLESQLKL